MPGPVSYRRTALAAAFGVAASHEGVCRTCSTATLTCSCSTLSTWSPWRRTFGSWMTQYGYANYVTQSKLLERGRVVHGAIEMAGRRFTTLATTFEPFPSKHLLDMMRQLMEQGGRVIWSGPPPVLTDDGGDALGPWSELFGVHYQPGPNEGLPAPGHQIHFANVLKDVPPQIILTHELVDRIYPVSVADGTAPVAHVENRVVGAYRTLPQGGSATFLGFRPCDNQSCSLGYDTRTWFAVLDALGAYPPSGKFPGVNDNTEVLSRTGDYVACRFPNGAITIARHLRRLEEDWPGGFGRDAKADAAYVANHPMPTDKLALKDFKVNGHWVSYDGTGAMAFRLDPQGNLIAFAGANCREITVDGRTTAFGQQALPLVAFAPLNAARRVPGGAIYSATLHGSGSVRIPAQSLPGKVKIFAQGATLGSKDAEVACHRDAQTLIVDVTPAVAGRQLWIVPSQ